MAAKLALAALTALGALWLFTVGSGAATPDSLTIQADGTGDADVDLDGAEADVKSALDGLPDTGTSVIELPPGITGSLTFEPVTITTSTSGEAVISGTATLFGDQPATVEVTATWAAEATSPTVTVTATLSAPADFRLTDLAATWTTGATDPSFTAVSFTLNATTTMTASIDIGATYGTNTATNLGVTGATLSSPLTADLSTLSSGGATGSVALSGPLGITAPPGLPSFLTATATDTAWNASIAFDAAATTPALATTIAGQVTVTNANLGLPTTPLAVTGTPDEPTGTVLSGALPGPLTQPMTVQTSITSPQLEIDLRNDPATVRVTGAETVGGTVTVPADASIAYTASGANVVADLTITATAAIDLGDWLDGQPTQLQDTVTLAQLADLSLSGLVDRQRVTVQPDGTPVLGEYSTAGTATALGKTVDLTGVITRSGTTLLFDLVIRPQAGVTLGDLNPSLAASPVASIPLDDVAIVLSSYDRTTPQQRPTKPSPAPTALWDAVSDIYCRPGAAGTEACLETLLLNFGRGLQVVAGLPTPELLHPFLAELAIPAASNIILTGSAPMFGFTPELSLTATLPGPSLSTDCATNPAPWLTNAAISLGIGRATDGTIGLSLGGTLGVRIEKAGGVGAAECGPTPNTLSPRYDYLQLSFQTRVGLSVTTGTDGSVTNRVSIRLDAGLGAVDGWNQAFGIEWLRIDNLALLLGASYQTTVGGDNSGTSASLTFGFRGRGYIGTTDFDTAILAEVSAGSDGPGLKLKGFRLRSKAGVDLNDILYLASATSGTPISAADAGLPNIGLKRIELAYAAPRVNEPTLCLTGGLVLPTVTIVGELYVAPPGTPSILDTEITDLPDQNTCLVGRSPDSAEVCVTQLERDAGCFAGVAILLRDTGLSMSGRIAPITLGPLRTDPTTLDLQIGVVDGQPTGSFSFSAGVSIPSLAGTRGNIAVSISDTGFAFDANVNLFGQFFAAIDGDVPFSGPVSVTGAIEQRLGAEINRALGPVFRAWGGAAGALGDVIVAFSDPTRNLDSLAAELIAAPAKIAAAALYDPTISQPEWLQWFIDRLNEIVADIQSQGGSSTAITDAVNALMNGGTIQITPRINAPGLYVPRLCNGGLGTFVGSTCYTVVGGHWWPSVLGIATPEGCLLFATLDAAGNTCFYPPLTVTLPGLCDVLFAGSTVLGFPNPFPTRADCSAQGLKNLVADAFDDLLFEITGKRLAGPNGIADDLQRISDVLKTPGLVVFDVPCAAFDLSTGAGTRNSFSLDLKLTIFDEPVYVGVNWDFNASPAVNAAALFTDMLDRALDPPTTPPTDPCPSPDGGGSSGAAIPGAIAPPSGLTVSGPASLTEGATYQLTGSFNDPSGTASDTIEVSIDWGDGSTSTPTASVNGSRNGTFSASHVYANGPAVNTISVSVVNTRTGATSTTRTVTVNNAPPVISGHALADATLTEGDTTTVSGVVTDAGGETPTVVIDWGDGSTRPATVAAAGTNRWTYSAAHRYLDDPSEGNHTVRATASDGSGGTASATATVDVANANPTVTISPATGGTAFDEGTDVTFDVTVSDAGPVDTHTVVIDWGDGTTTTVPGIGANARTFQVRHPFADDNPTATASDPVTIRATVTDDDSGTGSTTQALTLRNVVPSNPVLVLGDDDDMFHEYVIDENDTVVAVFTWEDPGVGDTFSVTIDWGDGTPRETIDVAASNANGAIRNAEFRHQYLDDPDTGSTYTVQLWVNDDDQPAASATTSSDLEVRSLAPTVDIESPTDPQPYSDSIDTITITASDVRGYVGDDLAGGSGGFATRSEVLTATNRWRMTPPASVIDPNGTLFPAATTPWVAGLPADLAMAATGCAEDDASAPATDVDGDGDPDGVHPRQVCGWDIDGIADVAPGRYEIEVTVADGDGADTVRTAVLVVGPEDAGVTYTGPTFAATTSARSGVTTIELRATVTDVSWFDPSDTTPGVVTNAAVGFVGMVDGSEDGLVTLCEAQVVPVTVGDTLVGNAFCDWTVNIGNADAQIWSVQPVVGGWYHRNNVIDAELVTVAKPLDQFVSGGGYLTVGDPNPTAGTLAADDGSRIRTSFNLKFNRRGTNLQGKAVIRFVHDGRLFQVRTNRTDSLGVVDDGTAPATAQFEARANLTEILPDGTEVPVDSGLRFQMDMTDHGNGADDTIGFTVWDRDGLLVLSSNWTGTTTTEQVIQGSLQVHG